MEGPKYIVSGAQNEKSRRSCLEAEVEDLLLTLEAHVGRPAHHSRYISRGLDVLCLMLSIQLEEKSGILTANSL